MRPSRLPKPLFPLIAIMLFGHIAVSGGRVASSVFVLQSGAGESAVGLLIGLYSVVSVLLGLQFGRWSDRFGPRRVVTGGVLSILVGILLPVCWPALPSMLAGAVFCGTGVTVASVAIQHAVGALPIETTQQRVALFGWLTLGHSTSSVLGPFIAGAMIDAAGFRAAFAALCVGTLLALVLTRKVADTHGDEVAPTPSRHARGWRGLLADPSLRMIYLLTSANAVAWDAFTFLGPVLGHRAALSATAIGTMMSCFALGTFAVRAVIPWVAHRLGEWRMLAAALTLIACVWALLPFARAGVPLFLLAFLLGSGVGCGQPNVLSLLHRFAPAGRVGEAIGLRSLFGNLSGVGVPWLFGATAAVAGLWPVCWLIAGAAAFASTRARRGTLLG
ncbi:MFS transporter [Niveibacterium sp.]|uniref:MFS transporter n=1 Tax=Niveibacterium sp. TaxID=2017444 RepID=UPI0035B46ED4